MKDFLFLLNSTKRTNMKKNYFKITKLAVIIFLAGTTVINAQTWEFDTDEQGWTSNPNECTVSWLDGSLVFDIQAAGGDPYVWNTTQPAFPMADLNYLEVRVKNQTASAGGQLIIWDGEGLFTIDYPITPNNTEYEVVLVDLGNVAKWISDKSVTNVRIEPNINGAEGIVSYDYIRFIEALPLTTSITVNGPATIDGIGVTAQMSVDVLPEGGSKDVTWSVDDESKATIDASTGLLTSVAIGDVTVTATATDGSGISGTKVVSISHTPVTDIAIDPPASTELNLVNDFKLLSFTITPANASNQAASWSILNGTGSASIDQDGKLVPLTEGTVEAIITSDENSAIADTLEITITNVEILVTALDITSASGFELNFDETLQLDFTFEPYNTTNTDVSWEVLNVTGLATIDENGLLTAETEGTVTAKIIAADGSGITDEQEITITRIITDADTLVIDGPGTIYSLENDVQLGLTWTPENTTWKSVTWSVDDESVATIDEKTGLLTPVSADTVTVKAVVDSITSLYTTKEIRILSEQVITAEWTFDTDAEGWDEGDKNNCNVSWADGSLILSPTGDDPWVVNSAAQTFEATDANYAVLKVKNETEDNAGQLIVWVPPGEPRFIDFSLTPGNTEYETVVIDLSTQAGWSNDMKVLNFRIDPTASGKPGNISFDYIGFISNVISVNEITLGGFETLKIGSTMKMNADVLPLNATNNAVEYTVDDEAIASIDPKTGVLTGVALGDVTVTATAVDGSGVSGQKVVTINNEDVVANSITVNGVASITGAGQQEQYSVVVLPENTTDKTVIYSVSDESVATIDANTGLLTTVSSGEVVITATAQDGSGVTGQTTVNVILLAESISIVGPTSIDGIGETAQLSAEFTPMGTTDKTVKWSVNKPAIATIDENTGLLTTVAVGNVRVIAEAQDGSGVHGMTAIQVINTSTSVQSSDNEMFRMYPNPVRNGEDIQLEFSQESKLSDAIISVADMTGKIVYSEKSYGQKIFSISTSQFTKGIYFIRVESLNSKKHMKVIVE